MGLKGRKVADFYTGWDHVVVTTEAIAKNKEVHALGGVVARVEAGSEIRSRITATRIVALGIFAVAAKKKTGGESYLTIEGPEFFWSLDVDRKTRDAAVKFAAKVNDQAKKATAES